MNNEIKNMADECARLNKIVKEYTAQLNFFKKELKKNMKESKVSVINGKGYKIRHQLYKNKFTHSLTEEFNNLSNDKINELVKANLVSISYKLNTKEYDALKKKNKTSIVDPFVKERRTASALVVTTDS